MNRLRASRPVGWLGSFLGGNRILAPKIGGRYGGISASALGIQPVFAGHFCPSADAPASTKVLHEIRAFFSRPLGGIPVFPPTAASRRLGTCADKRSEELFAHESSVGLLDHLNGRSAVFREPPKVLSFRCQRGLASPDDLGAALFAAVGFGLEFAVAQ